jgi:hypothetical protein
MTVPKASGRAMIKRIVADMASRGLEPDAKECELLDLAEGLADQLVALRRNVKAQGVSTTLESGRIVANPAVAQINTTSLALARVLGQISIDVAPPINRTKQRAAQARWSAHNEAKQRWEAK